MTEPRQIAFPTYVVAMAMIAIPLADVFTSLFPWRFLEPRWRFGAVGLISNSLLIPMVGLLVAYLTATVLEHRLTRRIIGGVSFGGFAICLLALIMFALDALQTRAAVSPEMRLSFTVASTAAALKTVFAAVTFMAIGISAFKGPQRKALEVKSRNTPLFMVDAEGIQPVEPSAPST